MKQNRTIIILLIPISLLAVAVLVGGGAWMVSRAAEARAAEAKAEVDRERLDCKSRLSQAYSELQSYASKHGEAFPSSALPEMPKACPTGGEYIYSGGKFNLKTSPLKYKYVIFYESTPAHNGERWFLMGDGHTELLPPSMADTLIANLKAGKNPPR